ncbi:MAG TPA: hypothetical protein VE548_03225 [Nitrososphaeraceae archaeon]|jgi:hypothetical protein|nr:hypothetical protein [Nitrososphaeraceae archaeon]
MIAPHIATSDPITSNLSGFFLSTIILRTIDEIMDIPHMQHMFFQNEMVGE